jgi:predicted Zn-dependent protease
MQRADRYANIHVYVASTQKADARAFPGGSIVVATGMIEAARNEAALVAVLGHELSHIDHGHQLRSARAAELAKNGAFAGNANPQAIQQHVMLMTKNFARPFRAEDEALADRDAARWAFELGYEPLELAKLFERLDQRNGGHQPNNRGWMPSFLLTHPPYENRNAAIREWSTALRSARPIEKPYIGRTNLEKRIPRTEQEFPE